LARGSPRRHFLFHGRDGVVTGGVTLVLLVDEVLPRVWKLLKWIWEMKNYFFGKRKKIIETSTHS
jgi:hypothetical protein